MDEDKTMKDRVGRQMPVDPILDLPMKRFYEGVDMDKLKFFLSENGDKFETLLAALQDPAFVTLSFAAIARKCRVTLHDLQLLYSDGMRQLGLLQMSTVLPQVMMDVASDALSRQVVCPRCDGLKISVIRNKDGQITDERPCPACKGEGEVRVTGDKHARDLVFESMKLTNQGGPLVAIQQNIGSALDSSMESMMKLTQSITIGKKDGDANGD